MKTPCVSCGFNFTMSQKHYEEFGKYCTACNAKCGYQSTKQPKRPHNPALDELYLELYGLTEKHVIIEVNKEYRQLVLEMTTYPTAQKEMDVV